LIVRLVLALLGVLVDEGGGVGGAGVAKEGGEVHDLVVTENDDDLAVLAWRLLLQAHEQIHGGAYVGAAVGDIAGLHEDGVAAAPVQLVIDQSDFLQDRREAIEGAVDVGDGDDSAALLAGGRRRRGGRKKQSGEHQRHHAQHPAPRAWSRQFDIVSFHCWPLFSRLPG